MPAFYSSKLVALALAAGSFWCSCPAVAHEAEDAAQDRPRFALILVGLPGDQEHEQRFARYVDAWRDWLEQSLGFPPQNIRILTGTDGISAGTKENLVRVAKKLVTEAESDSVIWLLVLAHADETGRRAKLHLAGPDISDMEFAELFARLTCKEQVFWLTHTCSSQFLRSLSRPGRTVISATAPDEGQNETEFPDALAEVAGKDAKELDQDRDGRVSLAELFESVGAVTAARYEADDRVPTEHAQLDDNGDGRGTEAGELVFTAQPADTPQALRRDGAIAAGVILPWKTKQAPSPAD